MTADITALDVPTPELERQIARRKVDESGAKLRYLLAHPGEFAKPADAGELAEYRHLLYDADPDSTVPAFPYPPAGSSS